MAFFPSLQSYLDDLCGQPVAEERQAELSRLADLLTERLQQQGQVALVFICTHNSRRSHFGQVWAQTLADDYGLKGLRTYSGGTEATACHPHTVRALREAGFAVEAQDDSDNPRYRLRHGDDHVGMTLWSKVYTDPANPQRDFLAVMTCDSANEACPVVLGAAERLAIMYQDPKVADGTAEEAATYAARCRQIAAEMNWVMGLVWAGGKET